MKIGQRTAGIGERRRGASAGRGSGHGGARGLVSEVRGEPALDLFDGDPLPSRVVLDLVLAEAPDGEVASGCAK
jgi:hypothetical protein